MAEQVPLDRAAVVKMRDTLEKERSDFMAQLGKLRQATAETEAHLQRTDGALVVVTKLLEVEEPDKPAKTKRK